MCTNCGDSNPRNNYNVRYSYGVNCAPTDADCGAGQFNAKCGYYAGPNLSCSGINTNDSLELALQKFDTKLCSVVGDYSTYNMHCLPTYYGASITNEEKFVDAITSYACYINTTLNTFTGTTFTAYEAAVNTRFVAIEVPGITCATASVVNTDTLQTVLNKYCTKLTSLSSAISLTGVNWGECFSVTTPPTTIADAFSLVVDQICSVKSTSGGALPTFNNTGTCLPSPGSADSLVSTIGKITTRLCASPTYDINGLTWGYVDKPSSVTTDLQNGFQAVLTATSLLKTEVLTGFSGDFIITQTDSGNPGAGKTITLATPINQDKYVAVNSSDTTPGYLQAKLYAGVGIDFDFTTHAGQAMISSTGLINVSTTSSISMVGNGTSGSPLAPVVKISASAGNTAVINSDGIYVPSVAAATVSYIETSTTKPTFLSNNLSIDVKIDSDQPGNILTFSTNGLYCPAPNTNPTVVIGGDTATLHLTATPGSGNSYTITGNPIISSTATHQILVAKSDGLAVQVSSTVGNAISINSDGIFVSAGSAQVNTDWNSVSGVSQLLNKPTITSGLTFTAGSPGSITLGGALTQVTTIDASSYQFNVSGSSTINNSNKASSLGVLNISGVTTADASQVYYAGSFGEIYFTSAANISAYTNSIYTSTAAFTYLNQAGNFSNAATSALSGLTGWMNFASSGNVTWAATLFAKSPEHYAAGPSYTGTVTNMVGLLIDDITASSINARFTNKFAIYQVGTSDISRFYGTVQTTSGSVTTISDARSKINVTAFTRGLSEVEQIQTHNYNYIFNSGKLATGTIAQELELIIPEAVSTAPFDMPDGTHYDDFKTVDNNMLIFTLINAVKELSAKDKAKDLIITDLQNRLTAHSL